MNSLKSWKSCGNGSRPKWARAQMGLGPNGHEPKWARAQMGLGPYGPGPKWALAQMGLGPNGPGPKWARAQMGPGPKCIKLFRGDFLGTHFPREQNRNGNIYIYIYMNYMNLDYVPVPNVGSCSRTKVLIYILFPSQSWIIFPSQVLDYLPVPKLGDLPVITAFSECSACVDQDCVFV